MLAKHAPRRSEHRDLFGEPFGRFERAAIGPEVRVVARRRLVVEDEEIADVDIFAHRLAIIALALGIAEGARRDQGDRESVWWGKSVLVSVNLVGRRIIK